MAGTRRNPGGAPSTDPEPTSSRSSRSSQSKQPPAPAKTATSSTKKKAPAGKSASGGTSSTTLSAADLLEFKSLKAQNKRLLAAIQEKQDAGQ